MSGAKQGEHARALRRFKPYPAYKHSGVEWLGEIPAHWAVLSLKRVTSIRYGLGEPPPLLADGLPFVRATNVARGHIIDCDMQFVDPTEVPWNRNPTLRTGDIIVVRSGAYTGDSAIVPEKYDGAIAGYDMVVRVTRGCAQFLAWVLQSRNVLEAQVELASLRAAQPHLNAEELGTVSVLLPTDPEQRAIARFLDRETARIDGLVAKKQRLIELLQEQRTALITRAVTKGLDPNVPMKDSGVEWLGEIPAHWEVRRLRSTTTSCQNGVWGDEPDGVHNIACVRVADFNRVAFRVDIDEPTMRSIDPTVVVARGLRPGDLLLEKSGGGENQPVGAVVLFDHQIPAVCSNFVARVTVAAGHDSRYQTYLHAALYGQRINTRHIKQSTGIQNLDSDSYLSEATGLPPELEQRAIAAFLDRETARIDALVAKVRDAIERLKELRAALISAAVTGKIDVREG